ncbi:hypothetical protein BGX38DRAFT_1169692 [Terfezia claveryi]|nr:hypothetical protein BGX38DRAFT_1169692 [Terfezia claveryi]
MKFVFVVLATFAACIVAQLSVPQCAEPCIMTLFFNQEVGTCAVSNVKCICSDETVIPSVQQCLIEQKCSEADIQKTIAQAYSICLSVGVTIPTTIPHAAIFPNSTEISIIYDPTGTTTATVSSTGAAATGANGLGAAGAAVAAFLFL